MIIYICRCRANVSFSTDETLLLPDVLQYKYKLYQAKLTRWMLNYLFVF